MTPSVIPSRQARTIEVMASSAVAGMYSARSVRTARRLCSDSPRSRVEEVPQIHDVLDRKRLVEAKVLPVEAHGDRIGRGPVSEVGDRRVIRDDVGQDERHHAHPKAEEHQGHQSPPDEEEEGVLGAAPRERRSQ